MDAGAGDESIFKENNFIFALSKFHKTVMNKYPNGKKEWAAPQIVLISSTNIEASKTHPQVREATGHVNITAPSYFNSAANGTAFKGTKYSAIS